MPNPTTAEIHYPVHATPAAPAGALEVICGSMFSGKTEELIRRLKRAQIARQRVQVFKPRIDNRYAVEQVASHDGLLHHAVAVSNTAELEAALDPAATVIAIDEVQFFDWQVIDFCRALADRGMRVIVAGLDLDFRAEP